MKPNQRLLQQYTDRTLSELTEIVPDTEFRGQLVRDLIEERYEDWAGFLEREYGPLLLEVQTPARLSLQWLIERPLTWHQSLLDGYMELFLDLFHTTLHFADDGPEMRPLNRLKQLLAHTGLGITKKVEQGILRRAPDTSRMAVDCPLLYLIHLERHSPEGLRCMEQDYEPAAGKILPWLVPVVYACRYSNPFTAVQKVYWAELSNVNIREFERRYLLVYLRQAVANYLEREEPQAIEKLKGMAMGLLKTQNSIFIQVLKDPFFEDYHERILNQAEKEFAETIARPLEALHQMDRLAQEP